MTIDRPPWYWVLTGAAGSGELANSVVDAIKAASAELNRLWKSEQNAELMTRDEVAVHLGVSPESVRSALRPYDIAEQRGYPRGAVEGLKRPGRGARTDLQRDQPAATPRQPDTEEFIP